MTETKSAMRKINIAMPADLHADIRTLSRIDGLTLTAEIVKITRQYITDHPERLANAKGVESLAAEIIEGRSCRT